eukprot:CAMPEP_0171159180 /NCGR_PEP_ID=MMETSP0790-20130122/2905_1 /TAXON_ID=2925 /ORGANISM="Alexandrium catenella, Strain OF101" /LENGTH=92 /DNA_ID=CAMNT_0011623667 /DNA_START=144 /DNA_END=418 /DNA_ORIENTATION=+
MINTCQRSPGVAVQGGAPWKSSEIQPTARASNQSRRAPPCHGTHSETGSQNEGRRPGPCKQRASTCCCLKSSARKGASALGRRAGTKGAYAR